MKTAKKFAIVCIIAVISLIAFVACLPVMGGGKREYDEPYDLEIEVTATTIKFIDNYTETCVNGEVLEYRIEGGEWQDSPLFEDLNPNTTYNVYVRVKENDNYKASKEHKQVATTSKLTQGAPNATYELIEKTVTVQADSNLEYSFDEGETYSAENKHTYTENGEKIIKVRYKESEDKFVGEAQVIKIKITDYYSGSGTEEDPYLIKTEAHFNALKDEKSYDSYFKLMSDLDFASKTFYPADIGGCVFDADNHTIKNINIENDEDLNCVGVFVTVGTVKNLVLENVNINYTCLGVSAAPSIGLIAGIAQNIINCKASGEIAVKSENSYARVSAGGLVGTVSVWKSGRNRLNITDSFADFKFSYNSSEDKGASIKVGGLLGEYVNAIYDARDTFLTISKCVAIVDIDLLGVGSSSQAAGLVGSNMKGKIENCYAKGSINTSGFISTMMIGGLIAQTPIRTDSDNHRYGNASIESCYADMDLYADRTRQDVRIGGISSLMQAFEEQTVKNCFFTGTIAVSEGSKAGLMGAFTTSVLSNYTQENCYHSDNLAEPVETEDTTAVSVATMKSVNWQRDTLKFSADIWNFVEGEYPTLK
ncbi:MAG: hypothetical protein K2L70_03350 [Clostridia bacterium]|nr:hypothetical protein [Clostridia bacterium]